MFSNLPPSQVIDPYSHGLASGSNDIFTPFLGPPPRIAEQSNYARKNRTKWDMPEVYVGRNLYLGETVEDWMLTANQTWYTDRIMPWLRTDDIHIRWSKWEFNPHYMGITPEQSMSMIVDSRRSTRAATMVRRGIGYEFEDGFIGTEEGRTRFLGSIMQIARSVQETANVEVIRALLNCHRYQHQFERDSGVLAMEDLDAYLDRRVERFMIAQKEPHGLETLNTMVDQVMEMWQGRANTWIFSRDVMDYCDLAPQRTYYDMAGQEGVDRLNGRQIGPAAAGNTMGNVDSLVPMRMIKDTPVYFAKSFHIEGTGHAELLSREMELGVFNVMVDQCRDYTKYTTQSRAIRVYDNDVDDWAVITLQEAIENCVLWDLTDGDVYDPFAKNTNRARVMQSENDVEMANDFLRYSAGDGGHAKQDVKYVGDLDAKWMTTKQMLDAGQTLFNAIARNTTGVGMSSNLVDDINPAATAAAKAAVAAVPGASAPTIVTVQKTIDSAVQTLLGDDSLFFVGAKYDETKKIGYGKTRFVTPLTENDILPSTKYAVKKTPVDAAGGAPAHLSSAISDTDAEERHQKLLEGNLIKAVPAGAKRDAATAIASDASKSWKERALAIKEMVHDTARQSPQILSKGLQNPERIDSWFDARIADYETQFAEWSTRQAQAASPGRAASVEGEIKHIPIGTPLPAGYEYLNADEERKARSPIKPCPTSLADFTGCPHLFENAESSIDQSQQGRRRGFAPIAAQNQRDETFEGTNAKGQTAVQARTARLAVRFTNIDNRIKAIAASSAPNVIKYLAILFLGTRFNKARFLSLANADIYVPCGFLLLRVHCTYRTRYGIKVQAGECGNTFYGHGDMQIGNSATLKVGVMHYTTYMMPVVTDETKVYVVQDIFVKKYLGGMGTTFWSRDEYSAKGSNRRQKSIICTLLPPNCHKLQKRIDVRGRWYTHYRMKMVGEDRYQQVCYPGAARTAAALDWYDPLRQSKSASHSSTRARGVDMNFICSQAVQFHYNPKMGDWGDVIVEQSEFGERVYPGCGKVRNGGSRYLTDPAYLGVSGVPR